MVFIVFKWVNTENEIQIHDKHGLYSLSSKYLIFKYLKTPLK
jgi:hypothetical protein